MVFLLCFLISPSFANAQALTKMKVKKKDGWGGHCPGGKPKSSLRDEKFHIFWIYHGKTESQEREANDCNGALIEHPKRRWLHPETPWLEFARTYFPYILTPSSVPSLNNHNTEDAWPPLSWTQSYLIFALLVSFPVFHKKHLVFSLGKYVFLTAKSVHTWQDGFATSEGSTQHNNQVSQESNANLKRSRSEVIWCLF